MQHQTPDMSVILVAVDRYDTLRKAVRCLLAQSVRDRLEVVIVAPCTERLGLIEEELAPFMQYKVVEIGAVTSMARARAAGIRQATAPVVVLGEDHSFPASGWAEALISAHEQGWTIVGPMMSSANPQGWISRADMLVNFGTWMAPIDQGPAPSAPPHNTSYKRDVLLEYGDRLESLLDTETQLQADLLGKGHTLCRQPAAKVYHVNLHRLWSFMRAHQLCGREFAAARSWKWRWPKHVAYTCGSALIPLVRLRRVMRNVKRCGLGAQMPALAPLIAVALVMGALGEMIGYALGPGDTHRRRCAVEMSPERNQTAVDLPGILTG